MDYKSPTALIKVIYVLAHKGRWIVWSNAMHQQFESEPDAVSYADSVALAAAPSVVYVQGKDGRIRKGETFW
jgi:hypothetical protein